jgi:2-amino-4-hydroxy-6-hydroxymethyldihydropteridine diphosphokinase
MSIAFICIGSNLGRREENCLRAIELLKEEGITLVRRSSVYETDPWGIKDQPRFLNMAVEIETDMEPVQLINTLNTIEQKVGRKKTHRWGPRVVDLDILLFDDIVMDEADLKIPHPLMHERAFVLEPLNEIAPLVKHPALKKTVSELFRLLTEES